MIGMDYEVDFEINVVICSYQNIVILLVVIIRAEFTNFVVIWTENFLMYK